MGIPGYCITALNDDIDTVRRDVLSRIKDLQSVLSGIERRVQRCVVFNDLGELQSLPLILDCRIATLATLLRMRRELQD
jgi:hypothetical protein